MRALATVCLLAAFAISLFGVAGDGLWLSRVPRKDAGRENPLAGQADAAVIGARLFKEHCAECHAENAEGRNGKPNLHAQHVTQATPGQLYWLLTNGSLWNGMPSWSRLPEQQRWALVSYLKTLPTH